MRIEAKAVFPKARIIPNIQKISKTKIEKCKDLIVPISIGAIVVLMLYKHFYLLKDN